MLRAAGAPIREGLGRSNTVRTCRPVCSAQPTAAGRRRVRAAAGMRALVAAVGWRLGHSVILGRIQAEPHSVEDGAYESVAGAGATVSRTDVLWAAMVPGGGCWAVTAPTTGRGSPRLRSTLTPKSASVSFSHASLKGRPRTSGTLLRRPKRKRVLPSWGDSPASSPVGSRG
jgi:hypothetical protein